MNRNHLIGYNCLLFSLSWSLIIGHWSLLHSEPWWNPAWPHRIEVKVQATKSKRIDRTTLHTAFPTGNLVRSDGADLRVVGPVGKVTPHYLLRTDPETITELYFKALEGAERYWIYFGNPKAEPAETGFEIRCGLSLRFQEQGRFRENKPMVLDTWTRSGRIDDYRDFAEFVKGRGQKLSEFTMEKIVFDRNDLVPSPNCVLVVHGWLDVPADGTYAFSIAADDPAAVVLRSAEFAPQIRKKIQKNLNGLALNIGDELLEALIEEEEIQERPESAQKTVLYFPGGRSRFSVSSHATASHVGKIQLKKGVKELLYLQPIWKGLLFAALAWQKPGNKSWLMLSEDDFVMPLESEIVRFEDRSKPHTATFNYREINTYLIDRHTYIEGEFEVIGPRVDVTYRWDFGDGVSGVEGQKVTHIYLKSGKFQVNLSSLQGGKPDGSFKTTAYLPGKKDSGANFKENIARYAGILRDFPYSKLPASYFHASMTLFEKVYPDPKALVHVLQTYIDTHTPVKEAGQNEGQFDYFAMPGRRPIHSSSFYQLRDNIYSFYMHLGEWQKRIQPSPAGAIKTYRRTMALYPELYPQAWFNRRATPLWRIAQIHLKRDEIDESKKKYFELEKESRAGFQQWYERGGLGRDADRYRHWIRSSLIGQADAAHHQGRLERLKELCKQASKVQRIPMKPAIAAAKRASYRTTTEDLIRHDWPQEALARAHLWEVEIPRDKIKGTTEFLRAKAWFGLGDYDEAMQSMKLARSLLSSNSPEVVESHFVDAEALFWSGRRKQADEAYRQFLKNYPSSRFAGTAKERLNTIEVIRHDAGTENERFLVKHVQFRFGPTRYPLIDYVGGWGGAYRAVHRWAPITYEFPIRKDTERIRLRFRKKGITRLHILDEKKPFWQEPHARRDEGVVDQELLLTDPALWKDGKLKLTFRDGMNHWSPYFDPISLYIDWIELHLLKLD